MTNIRNRSIKQFLVEQGIEASKEYDSYGMYMSPFRTETEPSFKVDYNKNLWYDFGTGAGGSIIDLVMKLEHCNFREAIAKIGDHSFLSHCKETTPLTRSTMKIVSVEPLQNRLLIDYIQSKRFINISIAKHYCREVHYEVNGNRYFAIGFQSDAGGWELRNEYFKGSSSPKSPTTVDKGSSTCLLFEGFIDMLSYLTLKNVVEPSLNMVTLNSVNNLPRAETFLQKHQTVHCFLDNDVAGKKALAEVEKLGNITIDQSSFYRTVKDLNEYLITAKTDYQKRCLRPHM